MAVTTEHYYTGNNSTTSYAYTFPYYKTSDIKVTWDGAPKTESTHYNVTGTNIVFTSGNTPANNVVIRIYRDTDVDTSKATFAAGSSIRATDLNNNELQLLYHAQEQQSNGQVNANISAKAEIDVSKLKDGTARQLIQTDAAGTGVEWTSNIDVPGTLDVTGATALDSNLGVTGNITVSGTVDGRNVSTDGTKLDGIEAAAKGDQTGAEIKVAYEAESNTNAYTDAEKTKLTGIATGANVTDANTVNSAGAVMNTDIDGKGEILIGDGSGDPTALAVGTNDYVLTADSGEATGVKWAEATGGGSDITVQEEGSSLSTAATTLNFVGANVTASGTGATKTITVSGGGEVTVQDEGSALSTAATTLNFVGSGVVASGTGATKTITISGGGGATSTDFQYLELKAHNNASGAFSAGAADYELVTKGTTTAVDPGQAAALMISIGGVIQEPNTGTSISSNDGFCVDGSSIHFGANLTAHPEYILWLKGAGSVTVDANSITNAKMADDAIGIAELSATGTAGNTTFLRGDNSWQVVDTTIADDSIAEVKLDISNAPADGKFLQYKDSSDKLTWTAVTGTPEGEAVKSTTNSNEAATKFLRADGDGTCSWQVPTDTNTTYSVQDGQLSQNNFTDADHTKLDGIATGATATPTTTRGDIIYRGASADARLAKGTAGQYLKIGANDPEWADVVGAVADGCIFENDQTISNNHTIAAGKGAHSVGPITVNATVTVNGNWVVS